jgi:hypothetical protein
MMTSNPTGFCGNRGFGIDTRRRELVASGQQWGAVNMTTKEVSTQVREMQKFAAEIRKSPEKARSFLHKTGMYTKNGDLKKQFR